MVRKVNHDELGYLIQEHYAKAESLIIYGRFGIGKSFVLKDKAQALADAKGKDFVEWNRLNDEQKKALIAEPAGKFVLIDIRLSEFQPDDIKGLPMFVDANGVKAIDWRTSLWALLLSKPDSDGILFFDEINLAFPQVMSSCYKIVYDRIITENPISKDWGVFAAGNLDEDRAYTHHIAPPLRDRASEVELVGASAEEWTEWAIKNGIDTRIIGFINFKPANLYKVDFNDKQKFTTYRGWERVSHLIKGITDFTKLNLLVTSRIGEGIGTEFVAFCKISKDIDLQSIIDKPERIAQLKELSIRWFVTTAFAEQYAGNKIKFDKLMSLSKELDKEDNVELVAYLWKISSTLSQKFKKDFLSEKLDNELFDKYKKYLVK